MKILLVVRWPVGGIRTFINYIYTHFRDPSVELHFVVPLVPEVEFLKKTLSNVNCVWHVAAQENPSFTQFARLTFQVIRANAFDVIHAHGFTSAAAASWMLPFLSARSIFTSHDVLLDNQFVGLKGAIKRRLMSVVLNRFAVIHSVSQDADSNLKKQIPGIQQQKCLVIFNGVDTDRFYSAEADNLKQSLGVPAGALLIGFFGRFMSQKGFKFVIEAMEQLEQSQDGDFYVVCFGSGAYFKQEKAVIEKKGLAKKFLFHAFVSDTAPYVKACDLVVMPSLWEACPLLPMEVLAAGVPLVASRCLGLREVCENTPAVLVEPGNTESLVAGIRKIQAVPRQAFIDYAPIAKDRFSVREALKKIQHLYADVVKPSL